MLSPDSSFVVLVINFSGGLATEVFNDPARFSPNVIFCVFTKSRTLPRLIPFPGVKYQSTT